MRITIFGSGYVGLVVAACFAEVGHHVVCVDISLEKINQLKEGLVPIYEPGLTEMLQRNAVEGRISYTTDIAFGVQHGAFLFIAVGTPAGEDGSADLQYVLDVASQIGQYVTEEVIVIDKSTVPVGTGDKVAQALSKVLVTRGLTLNIEVVSNPEFLREGSAIQDFMSPDRIVIGTENLAAREKMSALYAPFNPEGTKIVFMSRPSAELTKYAANSLLATKISFMNEMSHLAEALGADIESVRQGISLDKRIGPHFIQAGCGYGGSCFPKDVRALIKSAQSAGVSHSLIRAVHDVNDLQKQILFKKVYRYFEGDLHHKRIAVWGLAFKPNTDDMRESASIPFIEACLGAGASIQAYDPRAAQKAMDIFVRNPNFKIYSEPYLALEAADALVLITEWPLFRKLNIYKLESQLKGKVIFDGRNLYNPAFLREKGFYYEGIGRE
jgi:UDPglucose 6-dehydrogenase